MPDVLDVFKTDAFSVIAMTEAINKIPHLPGRIGELGIFEEGGVATTSIMIEEKDGTLTLVPTAPRGGPGKPYTPDKRKARSLAIPHIPHEDKITADELQNVRMFG